VIISLKRFKTVTMVTMEN